MCSQSLNSHLFTRYENLFSNYCLSFSLKSCLLVGYRIDFKIAILVFKCLHGLAPPYLADGIIPLASITGRRQLRSSDTRTLSVPRVRTVYGSRSFFVYGPTVWNRLPAELRTVNCSMAVFRRKLKAHFFSC